MGAREDILGAVEKKFGFVPNLIHEFVKNPVVAKAYLSGMDALSGGLLSPQEQQVACLVVSTENGCKYCVAAHSAIAEMSGLSKEQIQAVRSHCETGTARLDIVADSTRLIVENRGWLNEDEKAHLLSGGITIPEIYEIVALIGLKTISNYVNHIAHTPIDEPFQKYVASDDTKDKAKSCCSCSH